MQTGLSPARRRVAVGVLITKYVPVHSIKFPVAIARRPGASALVFIFVASDGTFLAQRDASKLRALIAREPPACRAALASRLRTASPPRKHVGPVSPGQLRSRGSTTGPCHRGQAKPVAQNVYLCTFAPLAASPVAGARGRQRQLSKGFQLFPVSLVRLASRQLATIPGIITPRECLALLSWAAPPPAASL